MQRRVRPEPLKIEEAVTETTPAFDKEFDFQPVWKYFRFQCTHVERQYQARHSGLFLFTSWCLCHIAVGIIVPITHWADVGRLTTGLIGASCCEVVLAVLTLLLGRSVPWLKERIHQVMFVSLVLMACVLCWRTESTWRDHLLHAEENLSSIFEGLVPQNPSAYSNLHRYIQRSSVDKALMQNGAFFVMDATCCGLFQFSAISSVIIVAIIVGPFLFLTLATAQPIIHLWPEIFLGAILISLVASGSYSLIQRRQLRAELTLQKNANASQAADSILNHTLKNTMADAAGQVELIVSDNTRGPRDIDSDREHLHSCVALLRRGMRCCRQRQAYLQLAANRYVVSLVPTRIRKFLSDLTTGRDISVDMLNVDILVNLDPTLCSLILDNAIVNAFKHGDERNPAVRVAVTTTDDGDDKIKVQFTITNRANQQSTRLSQTFVEKMFNGDSHDTPAANPWSDRIGLQHSRLAARAHNIALSLEQMDDTVTFQATLTTTRAAHTPLILSASQQDVSSFPKNSLRIYYIDDSAMARRIMESCLQQITTHDKIGLFGHTADDIPPFLESVLEDGDIAILDQNLDFQGSPGALGSELVKHILREGFSGLICIRSGNTSAEDVKQYMASGAHLVLDKDEGRASILHKLKAAYLHHIEEEGLSFINL